MIDFQLSGVNRDKGGFTIYNYRAILRELIIVMDVSEIKLMKC